MSQQLRRERDATAPHLAEAVIHIRLRVRTYASARRIHG
jgi:hypothetical protein